MTTDAVAVTGFLVLFTLMLLRVPVGMAMGLVGVSGFAYLVSGSAALKLVSTGCAKRTRIRMGRGSPG